MNGTNPKVEAFLKEAGKWREALARLRAIALGCGLTEEIKWAKPCYTFRGSNVAIIIGFKEYCSLLFFKGALLKDPHGILIKPGENTQAGRQIRFTSLGEIVRLESILKGYVRQAIDVERAGLKVPFKKPAEQKIPAEFRSKMEEVPTLKAAFKALTPGRQRAYLIHFAAPKQSKTRVSRIEKCMKQILRGEGIHDQYLRRAKG
jgi:uncharacterized protein YdeI (YjbR/CyaY-like superfamily)